MPLCPFCTTLIDADQQYYEFHVNSCLDTGSNAVPSSSGASSSGVPNNQDYDTKMAASKASDASALGEKGFYHLSADEDDDDLVIVGDKSVPSSKSNGDPVAGCPICGIQWKSLGIRNSSDLRIQEHVESCLMNQDQPKAEFHENDEEPAICYDSSPTRKTTTAVEKQKINPIKKALSAQTVKPQHGIISHLEPLFSRSFSAGSTRSVVLCDVNTCLINGQPGDFGWGCGWRNIQMLLSALRHVPVYADQFAAFEREAVPNGSTFQIPSIAKLQGLVEDAWKRGFDREGADHFSFKMRDSKKWIGATEAFVLLASLGIRTQVFDFPHGPQTHNNLLRWVSKYFSLDSPSSPNKSTVSANAFDMMKASKGSCVRITSRMPLYLQHQGHSRTIVGIEKTSKNGDDAINLLLFDPGRQCPAMLKKAIANSADNDKEWLKEHKKMLDAFRVNLKAVMKKPEYQIVAVDRAGPALTAAQMEACKVIFSVRIE